MLHSPVSVVQLATGHVGGAGLAARRLHQQLLEDGVESYFYCLERSNFKPSINEYSIKRSIGRKLLSKLAIYINEKLTQQIHFSIFSTNAANLNYFRKLSRNKTRVLHFHNWQNLISQKSLLKLIAEGFPIILTLHDERIATGGCHYRLSCTQNKLGCKSCPRSRKILYPIIRHNRMNLSQFLSKSYSNLFLVSPSNWLKDSVVDAFSFNDQKILTLLNPLGPQWNLENYAHPKEISPNRKYRVGVATMSDSFVKHGELLNSLTTNETFFQNYEITYLRDYPEPENSLSNFWKEIDVLLALSRADNSPNSIVEARSLGIPVLASKIGGIPELLGEFDIALEHNEHNIDGILTKLSQIKDNNQANRRLAYLEKLHSSKSFLELYKSLLKNS